MSTVSTPQDRLSRPTHIRSIQYHKSSGKNKQRDFVTSARRTKVHMCRKPVLALAKEDSSPFLGEQRVEGYCCRPGRGFSKPPS